MSSNNNINTDNNTDNNYENSILHSILKCQNMFITSNNISEVGDSILTELLQLSKSSYGYIAFIKFIDNDGIELIPIALSNISWDENSRKFYEEGKKKGEWRIFHSHDSITKRIYNSPEPYIINDFSKYTEKTNFPLGHLQFDNFVGYSLKYNGEIIGQIGLANSKIDYDIKRFETLQPLINTCANILYGFNYHNNLKEQARKQNEIDRILEETKNQSNFMANVSHEIRTPLNGIIGMLQLIRTTQLDDEQLEYVEVIHQSSLSLMSIINDVLDMTKLNAGKIDINNDDFDLRECVEAACQILSVNAEEKGLEICSHIDNTVPKIIESDQKRLKQILINLIGNAVKFTEKGKITITAIAEKITDNTKNNCMLKFKITDTGIGIKKSDIDNLFVAFTQVDSSSTKEYQGTGLGLAISKQLCNLMGGNIWCSSVYGVGSEFYFTISVVAKDNNIVDNKPNLEIFKNKKALIVDDNNTNLMSLSNTLLKCGLTPFSCTSAEQANIYIKNGFQFDIGLIDICMPKVNGISFGMKLRDNNKNFPLIALSSLSDRINTMTGPFQYHLVKPIKEKQLINIITNIFVNNQLILTDINESIDVTQNKPTMNILIAEDIEMNKKVIIKMLDKLGYKHVDVVSNGLEVIDSLADKKYDLLLLDIKMPLMDGIEVSKIINNKYKRNERPRIVALTAVALNIDREKNIRIGKMDGYITKPIDINELAKELKETEEYIESIKKNLINGVNY